MDTMTTVAQNPTPCKAFRATYGYLEGVALRDQQNRVYFADDDTGLWRELFDADAPALALQGRLDLIVTQGLLDGNLLQLVMRRHDHGPRVGGR
jgi:hypothetical protein